MATAPGSNERRYWKRRLVFIIGWFCRLHFPLHGCHILLRLRPKLEPSEDKKDLLGETSCLCKLSFA